MKKAYWKYTDYIFSEPESLASQVLLTSSPEGCYLENTRMIVWMLSLPTILRMVISARNRLQVFLAHNSWLNFHIWTNTMFDCHICLADTELMFCPDKDTFSQKAPSLYHSASRSYTICLHHSLPYHLPRKVAELWLHTTQHLAKESDKSAFMAEVSHTICRWALEQSSEAN